MMDMDYKEKAGDGKHVPVPKRVYITREDMEVLRFTAKCPGNMSSLEETARQTHTQNCRRGDWRRVERHCEGCSSTGKREGKSRQYIREGKERNDVEPGGRTDELHHQQRQQGTWLVKLGVSQESAGAAKQVR